MNLLQAGFLGPGSTQPGPWFPSPGRRESPHPYRPSHVIEQCPEASQVQESWAWPGRIALDLGGGVLAAAGSMW